MEIFFVVTIFIFQLTQVIPAPLPGNFKDAQQIQKYMTAFGYLPKVSSEKKLLLDDNGFEKALRQLQTYAGIDVTGVVDDQTIEILKIPRCGLPDVPDGRHDYYPELRRQKRSVQSWTKSFLTYKVGKYPTGLNQTDVDADVRKAFKMWSEASGLTFRCKQSKGAKVDIELRFENYYHGDEDSFDGPGGHVAHAFYPQYGGDAHFDNKEYWTVNKFTGTNLLQSVTHEIGHSLGLDHSNSSDSMMAPFYRGWDPFMKLTKDDIDAVKLLYKDVTSKKTDQRRWRYFSLG